MTKLSPQQKGYAMILMAGVLWGSIGLFVNLLKSFGIDSGTIAFLRLFSGLLLMTLIMYKTQGRKAFHIDKTTLFFCLLSGVFSQALFNFSYNIAIEKVGVATGSVLLYTAPVFVCIMSRLFFQEGLGWQKLLALAVNIAGSVLTVTGGDFSSIQFSVIGVVAGVAAGFLYGLMTILSKKMSGTCDPFTIVFYNFLFGVLTLALLVRPWTSTGFVSALGGGPEGSLTAILLLLLTILGYGLIPTVGSYIVYMKGLAMGLEASKVPVVASVETVVAALFGLLLFHESFGVIKGFGIALVLLSIVIMNAKRQIDANEKDEC